MAQEEPGGSNSVLNGEFEGVDQQEELPLHFPQGRLQDDAEAGVGLTACGKSVGTGKLRKLKAILSSWVLASQIWELCTVK